MGRNNKFEPQHSKNFNRKKKSLELRKGGLIPNKYLVLSLRYRDKSQGESSETWEDKKMLSKVIERFQILNSMTVSEATQKKILKIYGPGIPQDSNFKHPKYIDDDVEWASLRIQGKERIIGFLESGYVFNVVFFDMEHNFYPSKKKNT